MQFWWAKQVLLAGGSGWHDAPMPQPAGLAWQAWSLAHQWQVLEAARMRVLRQSMS